MNFIIQFYYFSNRIKIYFSISLTIPTNADKIMLYFSEYLLYKVIFAYTIFEKPKKGREFVWKLLL